MNDDLRVIEICAGAGGQALGLDRAGFEHELAIELDENAVNTLRHNRPGWKVLQGDVADHTVWKPSDFAPGSGRPIELFAGGVPCPPFSIAGKQLGASDERDLFAWAVEQVGIVKPRAVLLENVRGLSMPRFAGYRQHVFDRLREFGYAAEWRLLHASDYGVPQLRPRFVLVAMRAEEFAYFRWPEPLTVQMTVGEALAEIMSRGGWPGADQWIKHANRIAPTIVGGSKKHGGADLGPSRAKRAWAALGVDAHGVADSIPSPGSSYAIGPRLTCEMVARIQGWDNEEFGWEFTGRKTAMYRQIGNAFPPPVAKALGLAIAAALNRTTVPRVLDPAPDVDPIYRVLRANADFMSATQINRRAGLNLDPPEIDRRISLLNLDFDILKEMHKTGFVYKLGRFKAFTGEDDHARHGAFSEHRATIS